MPTNLYDDSEFIKLRDLAHKLEVEVAVLNAHRDAAKEALEIANKALDSYKSANNEWRSTFSDYRSEMGQYMTTQTADARFEKEIGQRISLADRVYALEKLKSEQSGKSAGFDKIWAMIVTLAFLAMALFGLWLRK